MAEEVKKETQTPARTASEKENGKTNGNVSSAISVIVVVVGLILYHLIGGYAESLREQEAKFDPTPQRALLKDGRVLIQYCQSWGTVGAFRQIQQLLEQRAVEDLNVVGVDYPVSPVRKLYGNIATAVQFSAIGITIGGDKIAAFAGIPVEALPQVALSMINNKFTSFMVSWICGNMVHSAITNSQAFEIYYGKKKVFSMLDQGQMPTFQDIVRVFKKEGVELILSHEGN